MNEKITLTYLNVRQSIAILLAKLIVLDIILGVIVIGLYFFIVQGGVLTQTIATNTYIFSLTFIATGALKIFLTIYVVLLWLNEYYEITPEEIIHKKGIIQRKSEAYSLDKVRSIDVQDSFFGEMFNFATVTLYDIRLRKYIDLYQIHNPKRYVNILKNLRPGLERKADHVNLPFMPKDEETEERE